MTSPLRITLSTGILYHLPLSYTFAVAHDLGLAGVELVMGPEVFLCGADHVRRLCDKYSVPVLSVHPPIVPYPGEAHPARLLPRLAQLALAVGGRVIVLHTPTVTSIEDPRWAEFAKDIEKAREQWPQVCVSVENSGHFRHSDRHYLLHDLSRLRAFADAHDLALTLDTAHAGTAESDLSQAYHLFASRLVNVHLSDLIRAPLFPDLKPLHTFFRHHQMPGEGNLPLKEFTRLLVQAGYTGTVTLELSPTAVSGWNPVRARARLEQAVSYLRQAVAEVPVMARPDPGREGRA